MAVWGMNKIVVGEGCQLCSRMHMEEEEGVGGYLLTPTGKLLRISSI